MNSQIDKQLPLFDAAYETWSYSRLKTLRRCALEYQVRYLKGQHTLFQPSRVEVQAGRLLHHVIREYYRAGCNTEPHRRLLEIYEKLAPTSDAWKNDLQGETRVLAALRLFSHSRAINLRPLGMEIGCKCWIGDRQFVGHADLIYEIDEASQACGILEFKLNDVEVRSEDVVEKFLQCLLYYMGLPEPFRESCRFASFYVFDTGEQIDREIDEFLLKRAERLVEAALQLADRQDFPPTRNPFCSSCGYQSRCPAYWGENIW